MTPKGLRGTFFYKMFICVKLLQMKKIYGSFPKCSGRVKPYILLWYSSKVLRYIPSCLKVPPPSLGQTGTIWRREECSRLDQPLSERLAIRQDEPLRPISPVSSGRSVMAGYPAVHAWTEKDILTRKVHCFVPLLTLKLTGLGTTPLASCWR